MGCANCAKKNAYLQSKEAPKMETLTTTTTVRSWTTLPVYNEAVLPEDLDLIGGSNKEYQSWRIPVKMILPGGTLNPSTYNIPTNATSVEVPAGQVTPIFIPNSLSAAEPASAANAGTTAMALAIAVSESEITIQSSGFLKFARPHMYEVGKTYYLSQEVAGEVVSVRPTAGIVQPLFTVIDQLTIAINISLY